MIEVFLNFYLHYLTNHLLAHSVNKIIFPPFFFKLCWVKRGIFFSLFRREWKSNLQKVVLTCGFVWMWPKNIKITCYCCFRYCGHFPSTWSQSQSFLNYSWSQRLVKLRRLPAIICSCLECTVLCTLLTGFTATILKGSMILLPLLLDVCKLLSTVISSTYTLPKVYKSSLYIMLNIKFKNKTKCFHYMYHFNT